MNRSTYVFDGYSRKELRQALKKASPEIFDDVLRFLEDDLRTFGSGYDKELMWRYVRRYNLESVHLDRLENVALKYLERPMSREFKWMALTMSRIGRPDFWRAVEARLNSENSIVALNAYCLFPYSKGIKAGEDQRLILRAWTRHTHFSGWYKPENRRMFDISALKKVFEEPTNWKDGHIVKGEVDDQRWAIGYYYPYDDRDFASIDWSRAIPEIVIPKLAEKLSRYDRYAIREMFYTVYAMRKMAHPLAVPVLITFLEQNVDYKYESFWKTTAQRAIFEALAEIGTPEAMEGIARRPDPDFEEIMKLERLRQEYVQKRKSEH